MGTGAQRHCGGGGAHRGFGRGGAGVHQRAGRAAAACLGIGGRPVMDPMPMQHLCSCVLEKICGPCFTVPVWLSLYRERPELVISLWV